MHQNCAVKRVAKLSPGA